jgi:hypothetical protein
MNVGLVLSLIDEDTNMILDVASMLTLSTGARDLFRSAMLADIMG